MRKAGWRWVVGGLALGLAVLLAGCAGKQPAAQAKKFRVGFSQSTMQDPWRIAMIESAKAEASQHPEIELLIADGQNDNLKQISDIEGFITKGVDLLIVSPREAEPLTPVVKKAYQKGIPVILLDRSIVGDTYTCFIGASNVEIGEAAGKFIAERLGGKGSIVEIEGIQGATPTIDRRRGMHQAIAAYPGLKVVIDQPADYLRSPARTVMENALQSGKKVDCVYAHNDEMALGAYLAAKAAGKEKEILFVGIDGQREAIQAVRDGKMGATFVYPFCGPEAIQYAARILGGEQVPKQVRLKTTMITQDNAARLYNPKSYF